jgi:hypothetical protein
MDMQTTLVPGSIGAIAQRDGIGLAESFLSADVIAIVDVSGSMAMADSRGSRERYAVACEELRTLQANLPGKIAVVAFSEQAVFSPSGVPMFQGAGTDMEAALQFVQVADGTVRFIMISDGQPNDPAKTLKLARTFTSKIDCVFVGPETDFGGAHFLQELAKAAGGRYVLAEKAADLADKVEKLLLAAG